MNVATPPMTLAGLGRLLDLDKSTVSLALRGSERIADLTRRRVQEAAERHGYRPNLAARQLIQGDKGLSVVGFYLPSSLSTLLGSVATRTMRILAQLVEERGLLFQLASPQHGNRMAIRPDAAFIWGDTPLDEAAAVLASCPRSLVLDPCHESYAGYAGPAVRVDNLGGGAQMARLLADRGAKRLLFVQVLPDHLGHRERWQAARSAWVQDHPVGSVSFCHYKELDDQQLRDFTAGGDGAILCACDGATVSIWRRLLRLNISMPGQLRLASFDGEHYARDLGLTTAIFDCRALANLAFTTLLGPQPMPSTAPVPFRLHAGDTT